MRRAPLTRPPAVAGSFYPAHPGKLAAHVDRLLTHARPPAADRSPLGLVVPHAGYAYSGPVAATAYAALRATAQRRDSATAEAIVAVRPDSIGTRDACGAHPLRGLLAWVARHRHAVRLLDLRTSADTAGKPTRVVGYGAFRVDLGS